MTRIPAVADLRVVRAGARLNHDQFYRVDRPQGTGDWLFVQFLTPIVYVADDESRILPEGACILFSPGKPQCYQPLPGRGYRNNWCHFDGPGAEALVARCGVPIDVPVLPLGAQPLGAIVRALDQEVARREPWWSEVSASLVIQLVHTFARACQGPLQQMADPSRRALAEQLHELRATIFRQLTQPWSVAEMAAQVELSPSRFAHLYREIMGTGPMDDLINARITRASELLSQGNVLVKKVAAACGFRDLRHFSKSFRARMGCTPSRYARDRRVDLP